MLLCLCILILSFWLTKVPGHILSSKVALEEAFYPTSASRMCHGTDRHRWRTPHHSGPIDVHPCQGSTLPYQLSLVRTTRLHLAQRTLAPPAPPSEFPVPRLGTIDRSASPEDRVRCSSIGNREGDE